MKNVYVLASSPVSSRYPSEWRRLGAKRNSANSPQTCDILKYWNDSEASGKKLQIFDNSIVSLFLKETWAQRKPNMEKSPGSLGVMLQFWYSETLLYGHPLNRDISGLRDSSPRPWGKKTLTFSLNSTRLIPTSRDYGQFASTLEKESSDIFSQFSPLILTPFMAPQWPY